jgi:glycosyltransferase involved in cell wall biosynthesis
MRRLVFATQKLDPADPILAATVAKVRALAERVDDLVVLCDSAVSGAAPANVRVHEFGAATQAGRGARFAAALARELRPRPDAFVAHMIPLYVLVGAPLLRPLRIPVALWYSHPEGHRLVRAAEALSNVVLSVDESTFPLRSRKLVPIGHGIDLVEFPCAPPRDEDGSLRVAVLGRYSPIKGVDQVLRAAALAQQDGSRVVVEAHGVVPPFAAHQKELEELARELGVEALLEPELPRTELPALLARSDALVNATAGTSADKVVYEAAASCVAALAASPAFADLLPPELRFDWGRPDQLAERLRTLDRRRRPELREAVRERHSVEHWADALLATVAAA